MPASLECNIIGFGDDEAVTGEIVAELAALVDARTLRIVRAEAHVSTGDIETVTVRNQQRAIDVADSCTYRSAGAALELSGDHRGVRTVCIGRSSMVRRRRRIARLTSSARADRIGRS